MDDEKQALRELRRRERCEAWIGVIAWLAFFGLILWASVR